jgi:hypothetical protein
MEVIGAALTVLVVVLLWAAAIMFGRDSREPGDWFTRASLRDRTPRHDD